jgi:hypothetical protein
VAYDVKRKPRTWVSEQARRRSAQVWVFVAGLLAIALFAIGLVVSNRATVTTSAIVVAAAFGLRWVANRRVDDVIHWLKGSNAETAVGEELDRLVTEGFTVRHDLDHLVGGNIDHVVSGSTGVYMVETKARGYLDRHLGKAKWHAKVVSDRLGGVWVTPVICIHRPGAGPFLTKGVQVVPIHCINDWIRRQRNATIDPDVFRDRL